MSSPVRIHEIAPLPPAHALTEEGLARYEKTFRQQYQKWGEVLARNAERLAKGSYSLHWLDTP